MKSIVFSAALLTTLRDCHNGLLDELRRVVAAMEQKSVPPKPCLYATHGELAGLFADLAAHIRAVTDALQPSFERVAVDAADYLGCREESFDIIVGAVEDFLAPIERAAEEQ